MASTKTSPENGFLLSMTTTLMLTTLVIAFALSVGVVVYFTRPGNLLIYNCSFPLLDAMKGIANKTGPDFNNSNDVSLVSYGDNCNEANCTVNITSLVTKATQQPEDVAPGSFRLNSDLSPTVYMIEITPNIYEVDPGNFTFDGYEKISMHCMKSTNSITLHVHKSISLLNDSITITDDFKCIRSDLVITHYERDFTRQFVTFFVNEALMPRCEYSLTMSFTSPLRDDLSGLFYSSYQHKSTTSYLAATLFSPIDARKAFPCFDEPALKARFQITLVRKPDFVSLSNMAIASTEQRPDGFVADLYEITPLMSTYLVAFVVCDFVHKTAVTGNGIKVRMWTEKSRMSEAEFALDTAVKLLEFYEDYFEIPYTFEKLDMVAIPDYRVKGMENWGMITFRDRYIYHDPNYSSPKDRAASVQVLAHEISHMWAGDLVTPAWWSELWLKEGIAAYLEYYGIDHIYPEWDIWERFVLIDLHQVFLSDSLGSTHPVIQQAEQPNNIRMLFNFIAYSKGATLMRMMAYMFGKDTLRSAFQVYLRSKMFGSATRDDLWSAIQTSLPPSLSDLNVSAIMDTWVVQKYYPLVTVTRNGSSITVTQEKFRADAQLQTENSVFGYRWEIPFTFTTSDEKDFNHNRIIYLHGDVDITEISNITENPLNSSTNWIIGNIQQYGYYRVNYDVTNWEAIIDQLKTDHTVIPVINRAQIINDAWNIAKAGKLDQRIALQTVGYLKAERSYVPWVAASIQLDSLARIITRTSMYGNFQEFMRSSFKHLYTEFSWTDASNVDVDLRAKIIELACRYDIQDCVDRSRLYLTSWMKGDTRNYYNIPPEIRSTVIDTAIVYGGGREWEFVYKLFKSTNSVIEKERLSKSMCKTKEVWILNRYLEMTLDPEEIRRQDTISTIVEISRNPIGSGLAWDFVSAKWGEFETMFGVGSPFLSHLIIGITDSFNTAADYNMLVTFMMDNPRQAIESRSLMQAVEKTLANIQWMNLNQDLISDWLDTQLRDQ